MNKTIEYLVSTQEGWLIRKATEYTTLGVGVGTKYLADHGMITDRNAAVLFAVSFVSAVMHLVFSKMASGIAAK
jgi:hypothetical protein